jgi:hypothetical protein
LEVLVAVRKFQRERMMVLLGIYLLAVVAVLSTMGLDIKAAMAVTATSRLNTAIYKE